LLTKQGGSRQQRARFVGAQFPIPANPDTRFPGPTGNGNSRIWARSCSIPAQLLQTSRLFSRPTRGGKGRARGCRRLGARARLRPGQSEGDRAQWRRTSGSRSHPQLPRPRTVPSRLSIWPEEAGCRLGRDRGLIPDLAPIADPELPDSSSPGRPVTVPPRFQVGQENSRYFPDPDWARIGKKSIGILPRFPTCRDFGKSVGKSRFRPGIGISASITPGSGSGLGTSLSGGPFGTLLS
jgi:hypothetical protein